MRRRGVYEKSPGSLPVGPRSYECDNNRVKKNIFFVI